MRKHMEKERVNKAMHIVVVGAGAAGLTAAAQLQNAGFRVSVFEARNRIGGRVWTDHSFTKYPTERGAEFIHGDSTVTWKYLKRGEISSAGGSESLFLLWKGTWQSAKSVYAQWIDHSYFDETDSFEWHSPRMKKMALTGRDVSVATWLDRSDLPTEAKRLMGFEMANPYLAKPSQIGVFDCAHEEQVDHSGKGNFISNKGYDRVIEQLAHGLHIELNRAVREIRWDRHGATLFFRHGPRVFADRVVIAVPHAVLRAGKMHFFPALPAKKRKAITTLQTGPVAKLQLRFRKPFWKAEGMFFVDEKRGSVWWNPGFGTKRKTAMLTAFITDNHKPQWLGLPKAKLISEALKELTIHWDVDCRRLFLGALLTDWTKDPWALGGYTYVPPGGYGSRQDLAAPVGSVLYFAGEATAEQSNPSTVHGAIESGLRAAKELREDLEKEDR